MTSPQPPKQTEPVQDAIKFIIEEQSLGLARGPKFDNALTVVCHAVLQQSAELERLREPMACRHLEANLQPTDGPDDACIVCAEIQYLKHKLSRLQRLCDEQALWIEKAKHLLPAVNDMRAAKLLTKSPSHSIADYRKRVIEECAKFVEQQVTPSEGSMQVADLRTRYIADELRRRASLTEKKEGEV